MTLDEYNNIKLGDAVQLDLSVESFDIPKYYHGKRGKVVHISRRQLHGIQVTLDESGTTWYIIPVCAHLVSRIEAEAKKEAKKKEGINAFGFAMIATLARRVRR